MRIKVIACEVIKKELDILIEKHKRNEITLHYMTKDLHEHGGEYMAKEIQKEIDTTSPNNFDAIVLIYGLCNNGIVNLTSNIPLVIPRAHDCITLFMGNKGHYMDYVEEKPGTYFIAGSFGTSSDNEDGSLELDNTKIVQELRQEYREKYGEENVDYLMEILGDPLKNYHRITYIENQFGDIYEMKEKAKEIATNREWIYEEYKGNLGLIERLLDGEWNKEDFLTINPGEKVIPSYDEDIIKIEKEE